MLDRELILTVPGLPAPKGSLKCIGGRGGKGHVLIEDNPRTKTWRTTISNLVGRALRTQGHPTPVHHQPVGAEITFTLDRPKTHFRTGANAHLLRDDAPSWPISHATGDLDKLLRLVLDALQDAKVLPDDCQVVEVATSKHYARGRAVDGSDVLPWPGVVVRLYPMGNDPA